MKFKMCLIIIPLLLSCDLSTNPEESKTYTFYGIVLDGNDNTPIDSVEVIIFKNDYSSSNGHYHYGAEILGRYLSSKEGYYEFVIKTKICLGDPIKITARKEGYRFSLNNKNYSSIPYRSIRYDSKGKKIVKIDVLLEKLSNL